MKHAKKLLLAMISCAFLGSLSIGAISSRADVSEIDESKFEMMLATSVRIGQGTQEDPTGIRFKTVATEFKADLERVYPTHLYSYNWYTEMRVHLLEPTTAEEGFSAVYKEAERTANVPASVWHSEGWNTVLLNLNQEGYADVLGTVFGSYIGAQSFVEVKEKSTGNCVYTASTDSYANTAAYTASWALNSGAYEPNANDTAEQAQKRAYARSVLMSYTTPVIESVSFTHNTASVCVGKSEYLTVKTQPARHGVIYASSDTSVATVSPDGKVSGLKTGTATITATMGSKTATCTVSVIDEMAETLDFEDGQNTFISAASNYSKVSVDKNSQGNGQYSLKLQKVKAGFIIQQTSEDFRFDFQSDYLKKTFAVERVKAISFDVYGLDSQYTFRELAIHWTKASGYYATSDEVFWEKTDKGYTITIYRDAYDEYLKTRKSSSEKMSLRFYLTYANDFYNSNWGDILTEFYIDDVRLRFADLEMDFEDGHTSSYLTTNVQSEVVKITDRSMGRGNYALQVATDSNSFNLSLNRAFLTQLFTDASKQYFQFRVYTQVDLESVYAMIGGMENSNSIEYRYYADGYYAVRIGRAAYESWAAENQSEMTLTLTAKESMGEAYIDALAIKEDKVLEVNGKDVARSELILENEESTSPSTSTFTPYAYSTISGSGKIVGDIKIYYDAEYDKKSLQEYKDAGYQVVMPQTPAQVGENGSASKTVDYRQLLDDAQEIGLKVLLKDAWFWWVAERKDLSGTYHLDDKGNAFDLSAPAPTNSYMYRQTKVQLGSYINHPAFYGVELRDEPTLAMLRNGLYGCLYRTIKKVAKQEFGKDIYIHTNQVGGVAYRQMSTWYPELTRQEYCDILGVELTSELQNKTDSEFKTFVSERVSNIWDSQTCAALRLQIMSARYKKYLQLFLDETGASYLMPDLYPLYNEATDMYFMELQTAAQVAAERGVDLYVVTQSMSLVGEDSSNERMLTEEDLRWMNNTLLSFGVKNIVYYTYTTRGGNGGSESYYIDGSSPILLNGERAPIWWSMQEILSENQAFASEYMHLSWVKTGVYYDANGGYETSYLQFIQSDKSYTKAQVSVDGSAMLVSELCDKKYNSAYMYAVFNAIDAKNQDVGTYQSATFTFSAEYKCVEVWRNGKKQIVALDENNCITIENAAGEAVYLIVRGQENSDYTYDYELGDNGLLFPGQGDLLWKEE